MYLLCNKLILCDNKHLDRVITYMNLNFIHILSLIQTNAIYVNIALCNKALVHNKSWHWHIRASWKLGHYIPYLHNDLYVEFFFVHSNVEDLFDKIDISDLYPIYLENMKKNIHNNCPSSNCSNVLFNKLFQQHISSIFLFFSIFTLSWKKYMHKYCYIISTCPRIYNEKLVDDTISVVFTD